MTSGAPFTHVEIGALLRSAVSRWQLFSRWTNGNVPAAGFLRRGCSPHTVCGRLCPTNAAKHHHHGDQAEQERLTRVHSSRSRHSQSSTVEWCCPRLGRASCPPTRSSTWPSPLASVERSLVRRCSATSARTPFHPTS